MATLLKDARFGVRLLRRAPWFSAVAVFTLGLGIAVNATVFGWVDSVLLQPLPGVRAAGELALIETVSSSGEHLVNTSYLDYLDYKANLKLVSGIALGRFTPLSVGADGKATRAWAELVSGNYFDVLGVKPLLGRAFSTEEAAAGPGGAPVAVISYNMWRTRFHEDPKAVGQTLRLNRHPVTIIGVAPRDFHGSLTGVLYDVWMPVSNAPAMGTGTGTLTFRATRDETSTVVRLKPGVTLEQAAAEVAALGKRLAALYPETNRGVDLSLCRVENGHLGAQGLLRKPLGILMALSAVLMLIVCANVANLLLARAVSRQKEFTVRLAMGASRARLAGQLLIETLLLALCGAAAGLVMTLWLGQTLYSLLPAIDAPLSMGAGLSLRTFGFSLLAAVAATLLSGAAPALFTARNGLNETLKEAGRSASGSSTHRLRGVLVTAEMALVTVALLGAALFYRSFQNASRIEPGFDRRNVSVSQFYLSNAGYSAREQWDFCRALKRQMGAKPGVVGVSYSDVVPMANAEGAGSTPWHMVQPEGYAPAPGEQMMVHRATIAPSYFNLFRIPVISGRGFTEEDDDQAAPVMVVNQTFAQRYFGGRDPVGRKVRYDRRLATVVGLVKDVKYHSPVEGPTPFFYVPFRQNFAPGLNFVVFLKTVGDPLATTAALRKEALALNQDATFTTRTLEESNNGSMFAQRAAAMLLSGVGAICLLLAAVGLYSVMSYSVSQRTREIGLRMALGAEPAGVLRLVMRQGMRLAAAGLVVGAALTALLARRLDGMLVGVSPTDPATFAAVALFLAAISAAATYLPARCAMRVEPMEALRNE